MKNQLLPIRRVAEKLGIPEDQMEYYGRYTAKLKLGLMGEATEPVRGKAILVTAMTPTQHGEGKTVVSIGLAQAIEQEGRTAVAALREPSLGPVLGVKGGATGGGKSEILPSEKINLHFNGDLPAVSAAHNLLAAAIDSHIHHGNSLRLDIDNVFWPRTIDMNDRALRRVIVGLGGKANGLPRESTFVITAASEVMAVLALAGSRQDLRQRLDRIVIGFDLEGKAVLAGSLGVTGAMMVLLNEALLPNLVQTTEGTPALVHAGPFANIAHGTSSVISQRMALRLADFVVVESGFGADLGAEKYLDIVMPSAGIKPSVAVLIATVRGLVAQGQESGDGEADRTAVLKRGFLNLSRHIDNLRKFSLPVVVAINRFAGESADDLEVVEGLCRDLNVPSAPVDVFEQGGAGGRDLAAKVMAAAEEADVEAVRPLYDPALGLEEKIEIIATQIYGAAGIYIESGARKKLKKLSGLGFGSLPICMAKTQSSLSDNPKLTGAPNDWTLTVSDAHLAAGAGFVVAIAGNMMLMPGLPASPQAMSMNTDDEGNIIGLR